MIIEVEVRSENAAAAKAALHEISSSAPVELKASMPGYVVLNYTNVSEGQREQFMSTARGIGLSPRVR